jgi:RNA-binding motif protein, X-linked 2
MNSIRQIQALNKRELENNVYALPPQNNPPPTPHSHTLTPPSPTSASWHVDYRDTAWLYIGGLPFDLSEGDILTIFSQYGEPVHVNLVRDKETGKSKGFAFLKYEDQRSTDLAVDNLGGATVMGRMLRVDHTRYKRKDEEETDDNVKNMGIGGGDEEDGKESEAEEEKRPMLKEERELAALMRDHDEEDPMKEYLIREKREEVAAALAKVEKRSHKHKHGDERSHRHRRRSRDRSGERKRGSEHKSKGRSTSRERERRKDRDEVIPERRRRREDDGERSRSRERRRHKDRYDDRT